MADPKFYSIGFNLIDNFTSKYDTLTNEDLQDHGCYPQIKIDVDQSVVAKTEEMGKRVGSSTDGISKSIGKVSDANKDMAESIKKTGDVVKDPSLCSRSAVSRL